MEMPDQNRPTQERAALQRLLRRRGRRRKVGANAKTTIKSWAEYNEVNFAPSGDHSRPTRFLVIAIAVLLVIVFPASLMIVQSAHSPPRTMHEILGSALGSIMHVSIVLIIATALGAVGILLISPFLWLYARLDRDNPAARRSLSAHADRINARHQTAMPPRDGAGVGTVAAAENSAERDGL
jgi:hypothetical protein